MNLAISHYLAILPELCLLVLLVIVIAYDQVMRNSEDGDQRRVGVVSAWGFFIVLIITVALWFFYGSPGKEPLELWGGLLRHDGVSLVFRVMFLIAAATTCLIALDLEEVKSGEFYALIITSTVGFNFMASASDLMMILSH